PRGGDAFVAALETRTGRSLKRRKPQAKAEGELGIVSPESRMWGWAAPDRADAFAIVDYSMVMRMRCPWAMAAVFATAGSPALSNYLPPLPLDVQLVQADLVVAGRLGPPVRCDFGEGPEVCAEILADVVIKDAAPTPGNRRYLILSSPVMEMSIAHIVIPESALLFMHRLQRSGPTPFGYPEYYAPIRGIRSVVLLNPFNLTSVQQAMCPLKRIAVRLHSVQDLSAC
ncbi:MAG: hypothetical protein JO276_01550, partial [Sphingomonadaceae bacterium]|nr:hypothetical protein [Sphingomonadaceae bacterium]